MVQGNLLGLVGGDRRVPGAAAMAAGAACGLLVAGNHRAGEGVNVIVVFLAACGEVHLVVGGVVPGLQFGGGEGGIGLPDARGLQGDGLGGIRADVVGLGRGLGAPGQGQRQQGGAAE